MPWKKGQKHSPETLAKIRAARARQEKQPNLKHGQRTQESRNVRVEKRLARLAAKHGRNGLQDQTSVIKRFSLDTKFNSLIDITDVWSSPIRLDTSLDALQKAADEATLPPAGSLEALRILRVGKLYEDMARRRLRRRFRLPDRNKKYCAHLWAILKILRLTKPVDVRMYIDGVGTMMIETDRMPKIPGKRRRYRILPIKTLASPLCVIDFLDFLMGYWKVVMGTGLTKKQLLFRKHDLYGGDFYQTVNNGVLSFAQQLSAVDPNPNPYRPESRFAREFPDCLNDIGIRGDVTEGCYVWASGVLGGMWRSGLLRIIRPREHRVLKRLEAEVALDLKLKDMLFELPDQLNAVWDKADLPLFHEKDLPWARMSVPKANWPALERWLMAQHRKFGIKSAPLAQT